MAQIKNRTIYIGDNINHICRLPTDSIDMVYMDPPFGTKFVFQAAPSARNIVGSDIARATFKDTWDPSPDITALHKSLNTRSPALYGLCWIAKSAHSSGMCAYLVAMCARLVELHRVLKPTGSIYLHVDSTAVHYLKVVMDVIFGKENFKNDLVWVRSSHKPSPNPSTFGRINDMILFYAMSKQSTFNRTYKPFTKKELKKRYPHSDRHGKYRSYPLTTSVTSFIERKDGREDGGAGVEPWQGIVLPRGKRWFITQAFPPHVQKPLLWKQMDAQEKLDYLDMYDLIMWPKVRKENTIPRFKLYLSVDRGLPVTCMMNDIPHLSANSKEFTGYPTQKPVALIKRFIEASTNKGDLVLDPFCGSGTTCVAAEQTGRKWIGMDKSAQATTTLMTRLFREVEDSEAAYNVRVER